MGKFADALEKLADQIVKEDAMSELQQSGKNELFVKLPVCPKCGAEDCMEHVKTEAYGIETHYDVCAFCGYRTDPE